MVRTPLLLLVLALLGQEVLGQESKTCYHCGYKCDDMHGGYCTPTPIEEVAFCGDAATMESSTKECSGSDECCGVLREYFEISVDGKNKVNMLTFHGCEKDMAGALGSNIEVICEGHANACYNVSRDDIHEDFLTEAKACFCDGDLCNKDIPDLPFPPPLPPTDEPKPTDEYPTDPHPSNGHKCYNCGYKCSNMVGNTCTPESLGAEIPFCGDVAGFGAMTKECAGAETECCGSLKEYFEKTSENGEVTVNMFAFHGCEGDLAAAMDAQVDVLCGGHENTCYNVSRDSIHNEEISRAEACFCDGELCNDNMPDFPKPTDGPSPTDGPGPGPSKTCYNCGYKCSDMHNSYCTPEPIDTEGKVPFCGDSASMESNTKQCGGGDECCGALREYFEMEVGGKTKVDMITFHGCEKDLAGALNSHVEVICEGHANACYNVSKDNIQDEFLTEASACFCDGDLCNKDLPNLPFPPPLPDPTDNPASPTTPCPECTQCYSCGYKQNGTDGEMEEIIDTPFCNDFADGMANVVTCGKDDCCGSLKEYFIKVNPDGSNTTEIIGRHGCAQDVDHLGHYDALCEKNGNSCWEVEDDGLDHDHDTEGHTLFRAEICLCDSDRCNNADPIPEIPTTTTAPGSASHIAGAFLTVALTLVLQI